MTTLTNHELFYLAHYAHNTLGPLFAEAKAIEPSVQYLINVTFADKDSRFQKRNSVSIEAHWSRGGMLVLSSGHQTRADIDLLAAELRTKIDAMQPAPAFA